ncbi:PRD domain-containing protein [Collinsella sp. An307]|uniref:PRD domain-containing protein n=1 Tax=Collinsella sp. An307 TaxID=1965630 RepID=UPI000B3ADB96|nr:PRD domain-containing protein [Collinsella sp. An307]OUO20860.1 transcription antiterminator BglG [Collinsella sp. An307]
MYRITKPLNHNAVLAFNTDDEREYLVVGKGVGFARKPGERVDDLGEAGSVQLYLLSQQNGSRGTARDLVERIDPVVLDVAEDIYEDACATFGHVDQNMLLPLADHLAFAVERVRGGGALSNPLTEDIRALFPREFEVADRGVRDLENRCGIVLGDDETGLIALHVHSALDASHVEQAMQVAQLTRACIDAVERITGAEIDVSSMDYNRLMTHVKYMVTRILNEERLAIDVNAAIQSGAPESYRAAAAVCAEMERMLGTAVSELEVGYLAMHIARVTGAR